MHWFSLLFCDCDRKLTQEPVRKDGLCQKGQSDAADCRHEDLGPVFTGLLEVGLVFKYQKARSGRTSFKLEDFLIHIFPHPIMWVVLDIQVFSPHLVTRPLVTFPVLLKIPRYELMQ